MLGGRARVVTLTAAAAIISSALSVMINIATGPDATWWVWVCVVGLTVVTWLLAVRMQTATARSVPHPQNDAPGHIMQSVSHTTARSIYQIGSVNGSIRINHPAWAVVVVICALGTLVIIAFMVTLNSQVPMPSASPPPDADIAMLDIWPSSQANISVDISKQEWAMTDFPVTLPYIRSIEVAAAPAGWGGSSHGKNVLLRILDAHGKEIDSGEAPIIDYRVKYVFSHPVDVRPYLGQHLYLQMMNITDEKIRTFFSLDDRDPSITSYVPCAAANPVLCPNPFARDLGARVVGRTGMW